MLFENLKEFVMKFTQRTLIITCVVVGIGLVGAQLSLKTMEDRETEIKKLLLKESSKSKMPGLGWYTSSRIAALEKRARLELVQKLQSPAAIDEFRDHGTVDGKPLDQLVSNVWALEFLKPALAGLVYFWDNKVQVLTGHTGSVNSASFSPDGTRIVTASNDNTARVWAQHGGTWTSVELQGHTEWVNSAVFSPDGTRIVTASDDNTARVWTQQGNIWTSVVLQGHTRTVNSAAFSPDGTRIVTASKDGTARVWTQQGNTWTSVELRGHTEWVWSAAFSPDSARIVTASSDRTARIWTQQGNTWTSVELRGHTEWVVSAAFSPDGTRIVTASEDRTVRVWTQIDLVGNNNVANKIMLLQLLNRDGKYIFINRQHLRAIWWLFDVRAKSYLIKKYTLTPTMWDRAAIAWGWMKSFVK
jgi:WD40 repeat protein